MWPTRSRRSGTGASRSRAISPAWSEWSKEDDECGLRHERRAPLAYSRVGRGPLLLCQCGGPGFPGATLCDLGSLSGERELVILDPRGAGASDRPAGTDGYRLQDYVADLDELRRHLDLDTFDLLGHAHGGFVAMTYASSGAGHFAWFDAPDRFRKEVAGFLNP
jgi:pimeloyl-ACP methyl ester carboxylesterase